MPYKVYIPCLLAHTLPHIKISVFGLVLTKILHYIFSRLIRRQEERTTNSATIISLPGGTVADNTNWKQQGTKPIP